MKSRLPHFIQRAGAAIAAIFLPFATKAQEEPAPDPMMGKLQTIAEKLGFRTLDTQNPEQAKLQLTQIIGNYLNLLLALTGIIFLIIIFIAGRIWMTAGGNEQSVAKAKKMIINSVIGIVITALAYAFTRALGVLLQQSGIFQ